MHWLLVLVAIGVTIGVFVCLFDHAVMIASAIFGSYYFMRGWSLMLGGYPNELSVAIAASNNDLMKIDSHFYIYLSVFFVGAALSLLH